MANRYIAKCREPQIFPETVRFNVLLKELKACFDLLPTRNINTLMRMVLRDMSFSVFTVENVRNMKEEVKIQMTQRFMDVDNVQMIPVNYELMITAMRMLPVENHMTREEMQETLEDTVLAYCVAMCLLNKMQIHAYYCVDVPASGNIITKNNNNKYSIENQPVVYKMFGCRDDTIPHVIAKRTAQWMEINNANAELYREFRENTLVVTADQYDRTFRDRIIWSRYFMYVIRSMIQLESFCANKQITYCPLCMYGHDIPMHIIDILGSQADWTDIIKRTMEPDDDQNNDS